MIIYRLICALFMLSQLCIAQETVDKSPNILIVYLSRTNNTKVVAELIHEKVAGELVALELTNPYPENYNAIVAKVAEENRTGFLPTLKTKVDITKYDTVFLGFPTWGMQLPPPIKTFLSQYNLKGKTVIPFNTNAGYGIGSSIRTIRELCPGSKLLKEFSITGGIERDGVFLAIQGKRKLEVEELLNEWLESLNLLTIKK